MTAYEQARAKADQIKAEVEQKKAVATTNGAIAIEALKNNPVLAQLYSDNKDLGADNLAGGNIPYLKIYSAGKSRDVLADGKKPQHGNYFYTESQEQFETVEVRILTISRSFYANGMAEEGKDAKAIFNQIMAGVLLNGGMERLFFMYLTGNKLRPMWDFGEQLSVFKKAGYPMFSLKVTMGTDEIDTKYGSALIPTFSVNADGAGNPEIITDVEEFNRTKLMVEKAEEMISQIIAQKEVESPKLKKDSVPTRTFEAQDIQGETVDTDEPPF